MSEGLGYRLIYVDSGPAGSSAPGEQIIDFKPEGTRGLPTLDGETQFSYGLHPVGTLTASTSGLTSIVHLPVYTAPRYGIDHSPMVGNEGSDLIGVYWALDSLGPVLEGSRVEICGDGQVFDMLRGEGRVSARWGGKNWAPDLEARIREAEETFADVRYRTIASAQNPAGNLVDELKNRSLSIRRK
jgi:hypothetical protein